MKMTSDGELGPEILPLGLDGVLVRFAMATAPEVTNKVLGFVDLVRQADIAGVLDASPALTSVLIRFDPDAAPRAQVAQALKDLAAKGITSAGKPTRRWTIPAAFGGEVGPQLLEAATLAGRTQTQAIADLTEARMRVLAIGFAPGQPYLGMLPAHWGIARQTQLTPSVPAGALVVAVQQLVLFGNVSTTGWRHIGLCAFRPFNSNRTKPFALRQGDEVRLVAASADDIRGLEADPQALGGARCEVLA
jgi:KipI family sensor histidine kinase inhibitor